jgi:ribosomal protein S7
LSTRKHYGEKQYALSLRFDDLLNVRKDKVNRYFVFFLFFHKDYFVNKLITKIMRSGHKMIALSILKKALFHLKQVFGFQPFFFFKHVAFRMRQLFKVQKTTIRNIKNIYLPLFLKPHNQVSYGINHIMKCAREIAEEEHKTMSDASCVVLSNCFVSF